MEEIVINSVAEYVKVVCEKNSDLKKNRSNDETLLFRGQANKDNKLIPSIGRSTAEGKALILEERNMIEMARYKLPTVFRKELEPIELLALLQHHGIPTRLLDVSENALVGLYFACNDDENTIGKDAEVIIFESNDNNIANYPMVNEICNSYKNPGNVVLDNDDILFVYAPSYSLRQNIQSGRYILFPDSFEDGIRKIKEIPKSHKGIVGRIIIPSKVKKQIRKDLRILGVSREILFLDNTDMVCKGIAKRFGERL